VGFVSSKTSRRPTLVDTDPCSPSAPCRDGRWDRLCRFSVTESVSSNWPADTRGDWKRSEIRKHRSRKNGACRKTVKWIGTLAQARERYRNRMSTSCTTSGPGNNSPPPDAWNRNCVPSSSLPMALRVICPTLAPPVVGSTPSTGCRTS